MYNVYCIRDLIFYITWLFSTTVPTIFAVHNVTSGHVQLEQAPFAPAIARCYEAILSIEHNLSQKLDLEAIAIVAN